MAFRFVQYSRRFYSELTLADVSHLCDSQAGQNYAPDPRTTARTRRPSPYMASQPTTTLTDRDSGEGWTRGPQPELPSARVS